MPTATDSLQAHTSGPSRMMSPTPNKLDNGKDKAVANRRSKRTTTSNMTAGQVLAAVKDLSEDASSETDESSSRASDYSPRTKRPKPKLARPVTRSQRGSTSATPSVNGFDQLDVLKMQPPKTSRKSVPKKSGPILNGRSQAAVPKKSEPGVSDEIPISTAVRSGKMIVKSPAAGKRRVIVHPKTSCISLAKPTSTPKMIPDNKVSRPTASAQDSAKIPPPRRWSEKLHEDQNAIGQDQSGDPSLEEAKITKPTTRSRKSVNERAEPPCQPRQSVIVFAGSTSRVNGQKKETPVPSTSRVESSEDIRFSPLCRAKNLLDKPSGREDFDTHSKASSGSEVKFRKLDSILGSKKRSAPEAESELEVVQPEVRLTRSKAERLHAEIPPKPNVLGLGIRRGRPSKEEVILVNSLSPDRPEQVDTQSVAMVSSKAVSVISPKQESKEEKFCPKAEVSPQNVEKKNVRMGRKNKTFAGKTRLTGVKRLNESANGKNLEFVLKKESPSLDEVEQGDVETPPTPSSVDGNLQRVSKRQVRQKPQPVLTKREQKEHFDGQHPLISTGSSRQAIESDMIDAKEIIPSTLCEKSLATVLTRHKLLLVQSNIVQGRAKQVRDSKLLLRRNLSYNLAHRRFRDPPAVVQRNQDTKERNLECVIQQIIACKDDLDKPLPNTSWSSKKMVSLRSGNPVELEVLSFELTKSDDSSPSSPKKVDLQFAVLKKNPTQSLVRELLLPVLAVAPKISGSVHNGGKGVAFPKSRVRVASWNPRDFLVVNMNPNTNRNPAKAVAFNICDIKEGLALEVPKTYSLRLGIRSPIMPGPSKVDYKFVLIYPPGQHHEVKEMVVLRHHFKGHSCILCGLRCTSICTLLRHIHGLHPSVGHQYDQESMRIYIWFAPEGDFLRANVPGFVDHWEILKYRTRNDGCKRLLPDFSINGKYPDGRPVLQWFSKRYRSDLPEDFLPEFDVNQLLRVYGVPINPVRHFLHTDSVQTIRPDYAQIHTYDSDDDTDWQDEYEQEKIHDFIDCSPQEKQFMCLWNAFTRRLGPIFSMGMKDVLVKFVTEHAMEIDMIEGYSAFCAQLSVFRRENIISAADSLEVVESYRQILACRDIVVRKRNVD